MSCNHILLHLVRFQTSYLHFEWLFRHEIWYADRGDIAVCIQTSKMINGLEMGKKLRGKRQTNKNQVAPEAIVH